MKSTFIFFSWFVIFAQFKPSYFDVGHINAIFYNFTDLTAVNMMRLENYSGSCIPRHVRDPSVEQFYYNIGTTSYDCPGKTIACIKFYNDTKFYSLSNSRDWSFSETGNNITFDSLATFSFIPKTSMVPIGPAKRIGSIKFAFECSYLFYNSTLIVSPNTYNYTLIIRDSSTCQKKLNGLLLYFYPFSYVLGGISILIGLFLISLGLKNFRSTLFINGAILSFLVVTIIVMQFYENVIMMPLYEFLIYFFGTLAFAVAIGSIFVIFNKVGIIGLGVSFGACLGILIYDSLMTDKDLYILYICCTILACIFGVLVILLPEHIAIISITFIGSFLFIRGISLFAGGFPIAFLINLIIKSGGHFSNAFYIYLAAILALSSAGVIFHEKYNSKEFINLLKNEKEGDNSNYTGLTAV